MNAKVVIAIVVFLLAAIGVSYELGHRTGLQTAIVQSDAQSRIAIFHALYLSAQKGDVTNLQSNLGIFLLGEVRAYEYRFGDVPDTNRFGERFREAKQIAAQIERQLIPLTSLVTNVPPSFNVKDEGQRKNR
jgi:hypothetical protein